MRPAGFVAAMVLAGTGTALAFPIVDQETSGAVPSGTELEAPDLHDLQAQLNRANGVAAPRGGGWTIVPRIDWQEEFSDNIRQQSSGRTADLASFVTPGIAIAGSLPRVNLSFDYSPTLAIYARTGDLNALTQQLNGLGNVTVVPELAFVDVRATSGVQSLYGGIGTLGQTGGSPVAGTAGNAAGLNRNNETQTTSFGISPYVMRRFGDWGSGRLGYSLDVTDSASLSGFAASPFPSGGTNARHLVTNEGTGHFATGEVLQSVQDALDINASQSQSSSGANFGAAAGVAAPQAGTSFTSTRLTANNTVTYAVNRTVSVFGSGGYESILYSSAGARPIRDFTWTIGTTITPNPDSLVRISYGHQSGINSLSLDGHYALTARTLLTMSYGSTLGTQLEAIQSQLNQATPGLNGGLNNALTPGTLFGASNSLLQQDGVFRTTTMSVGVQTSLDRDVLSLTTQLAKQTRESGASGTGSESSSVSLSWTHQMRPDMTLTASGTYSKQTQLVSSVARVAGNAGPGDNTVISASLAWQWLLSESATFSVRYAYFDRHSASALYSVYQNMLILGLTKRF
jgi:uncharacterized protein (PEP-CTERM system associated)